MKDEIDELTKATKQLEHMWRRLLPACCVVGVLVGLVIGFEIKGPARDLPVVHIVDGDTFDVTAAGKPMRIRIAAIDTAERGEPGADEATEYLRQLIEGKNVRLSYEDIEPRRWIFGYPVGPFGRLLAHPHVEVDGGELDVGQEMIDSGHAVRWPRRWSARTEPAEKRQEEREK